MKPLLLLAALLLYCAASLAEPVRFGSLSLQWPEGFTVKSTQVPFELEGPNNQKVLVTIMRLGKAANPETEPVDLGKLQAMNERFLTAQAQKAGNIVVPLSKESLPDGSLLQFVASETGGVLRKGYFIQYIITSSSGRLGFITFEGIGDATSEHENVKPLFQSAVWAP